MATGNPWLNWTKNNPTYTNAWGNFLNNNANNVDVATTYGINGQNESDATKAAAWRSFNTANSYNQPAAQRNWLAQQQADVLGAYDIQQALDDSIRFATWLGNQNANQAWWMAGPREAGRSQYTGRVSFSNR